jgi:hypothetical protein
MDEKIFKTEFRIKKEARELAIYNEWNELMKQPGAMATAVDRYLTQKYEFGSETTVWFICRRVRKRLAEAEENQIAQEEKQTISNK